MELQGRVATERELRALDREATVCSELGEPGLGWVSGSGWEEVGWVVEAVPESEGLEEVVGSELVLLGWAVEPGSGFSKLVWFSPTTEEL